MRHPKRKYSEIDRKDKKNIEEHKSTKLDGEQFQTVLTKILGTCYL